MKHATEIKDRFCRAYKITFKYLANVLYFLFLGATEPVNGWHHLQISFWVLQQQIDFNTMPPL
jgi:hypothetical protein